MYIPYPATATLGAGVYYTVHHIVGKPSFVFLSELRGGFVVFGGGWLVVGHHYGATTGGVGKDGVQGGIDTVGGEP